VVVEEIKRQTRELARELNVRGLMNVQFAVQRSVMNEPYRCDAAPCGPRCLCLEVNPRASRTVPFVAKATGVPLARHGHAGHGSAKPWKNWACYSR
jgi:carbamoyl-phosphate synthase large subunit